MPELVFSNYKEPLKNVEGGFGYMGALAMTKDGSLLQCHVCGTLTSNLAIHARAAHQLRADAYREKFELSQGTSLISETERFIRKEKTRLWWASMTPAQREKIQKNLSHGGKKWTQRLEAKNKHGYCPDQLLSKIRDVKNALGYVPSLREFQREMNRKKTGRAVFLIYKTFGSWNNALKLAGMPINEKQNTTKWTDEQLLGQLKTFYGVYGKLPTKSDAQRGLIPSKEVYRKHFGGLPRARELAGLFK